MVLSDVLNLKCVKSSVKVADLLVVKLWLM